MVVKNSCPSQQTSLRDTYISATEPVYPFYTNFVIIDLVNAGSDGHVLNLGDAPTIGDANGTIWKTPDGQQPWTSTTPFYQNTHAVRVWSNTGFWYNDPSHYATNPFVPHSRSRRVPEAQYGDALFMHALLNGMGYLDYDGPGLTVPAQLPQDPGFPTDLLTQYNNLNCFADSTPPRTGIPFVGGLNLTLFNITARRIVPPTPPPCPPNPNVPCKVPSCIANLAVTKIAPVRISTPITPALIITIWPLVSGTNSNNLPPPENQYPDWDGFYPLGDFTFGSVEPLPTIQYEVNPKQKCFYVTLPVQLFTLTSVGTNTGLTFTSRDLKPDAKPNVEVLAVKLKGTFVDETGVASVTAANAAGIRFEIVSPSRSPFNLTLSYQENHAVRNRPIYCFEAIDGYEDEAVEPFIPIFDANCEPLPFNPSLLFTPKCGPGIWTNLVNPGDCSPA